MSIWNSLRELSEKDHELIGCANRLLYMASIALTAVPGNDILVNDIKRLLQEIEDHSRTDHRFRPDAKPFSMKELSR